MPNIPKPTSSMPWVKLWTDFPDDPKIAKCSEGAQLLFVKLLAIAGQCDAEGYLVNGDDPLTRWDIAWRLRMDLERAGSLIDELLQMDLLADDEGYLLIPNFSKRQGRSQMQKREQWRDRQERHRGKDADIVTGDSDNVTRDNIECHAGVTLPEERREEGEERREEGEDPSTALRSAQDAGGDWLPVSPKQAMKHSDIQIFREVAERIPGTRDYGLVIQTIQLLRQKIPEEKALIAYLSPFWLAWSGRKTKDGRPYDLSSLVWLTEWAVNDHIPPAYANGNGAKAATGPPAGMPEAVWIDLEYLRLNPKGKQRKKILEKLHAQGFALETEV